MIEAPPCFLVSYVLQSYCLIFPVLGLFRIVVDYQYFLDDPPEEAPADLFGPFKSKLRVSFRITWFKPYAIDETFLKNLPTSPGVYLMEDSDGKVIYVGKAANIRNRVRNYFSKSGDERPKVRFLVQHISEIRTILTETEKEALLLENNLIKEHRPKYNVNLRDDKSFFSLRLNIAHPYPRLTLIRTQKIKPDSAKYFGPYSSARDARITLNLIRKIFPLRQCSDRHIATTKRPCINCQMNRCLCPCTGNLDQNEYRRMVENVSLFLEGKNEELTKALKREMELASENLRFEEAARIRDRLYAIDRTLQKQNVSFFHFKDQDVFVVLEEPDDTYVVEILSLRKGNLLAEESFIVRNSTIDEHEVLNSSIKQFYYNATSVPAEIIVPKNLERQEIIESWLSDLRGSKVRIRVGIRGPRARLDSTSVKKRPCVIGARKTEEIDGKRFGSPGG